MRSLAAYHEQLMRWQRTPYRRGMCMPGRNGGADCVQFVAAVLEWIDEYPPIPPGCFPCPVFPPHASMNDASVVRAVVRYLVRKHRANRVRGEYEWAPGDVVGTRLGDHTLGHVLVAGAQPNTFWHATGTGIVWTGLGWCREVGILAVWRLPAAAAMMQEALACSTS